MISCWAGSAAANRPELLVPSLLLRLCQLALAPLLYLCAFTAHAQGSVARPRIESFFGHQPFSNPVLSPDGKLLAVIVGMAGKRDSLAVIELATDRVYPTAHFVDADIGQARWVNNERLVFSSEDKSVGQGDNLYGPGMYAVNVDGSKFRQLARRYAEGVVDTAGIYRTGSCRGTPLSCPRPARKIPIPSMCGATTITPMNATPASICYS